MDEPKPLDSLFKEKLFRIPDYQRGYAWGRKQLDAFWEDLINLPDDRSHYTGVLTLKEIPSADVQQDDKEFWLVDDHSYKLYHIVDGQQRLTTFTLFLQAFIELLRSLPENEGQKDDAIYLTETLSIAAVESKFLFKVKPAGKAFRTYKFGYTVDNPSDEYMRYRILGEEEWWHGVRDVLYAQPQQWEALLQRATASPARKKKGSQGSKACTAR